MLVTIKRKLWTVITDFVTDRMRYNLLTFCTYRTVVKVDSNKTGHQNQSVRNTEIDLSNFSVRSLLIDSHEI